MDWHLRANHNGHIACTHGGECLAGLKKAIEQGIVTSAETAIVDSTAHALKFSGFQELYFEKRLAEAFEVESDPELVNAPLYVHPEELQRVPAPGKPLNDQDFDRFVRSVSKAIADDLGLTSAAG
jgi:threonine synthase